METTRLKKFAQEARQLLMAQVSARMDHVLSAESPARREVPKAVQELEHEIAKTNSVQVVEKVAYTWFNRLTALRFMDVNGYTSTGIVSPTEGRTRPEILADAAAGVIDKGTPNPTKQAVRELLEGRVPSLDPQGEAYRLLLVATCNQWHAAMPFLFEKIADYAELLMPADLLSTDSILARMCAVITEDACKDVEIIGWLYQFYISEKKDEVFAGLKKNVKITPENIPAATQLFTPHWIVRYLVENSLGRLWMLNNPGSFLVHQMEYYIAPKEPEENFLRISSPEEIKICDPAVGSGHMLTYAFDLLFAIYEEDGYDAREIPALILAHNLTGVEIDDRAGALAALALAMKAAAKLGRRRFLRMKAKPDICVLQNVAFTESEMQDVAAMVGKELFTDEMRKTLGQFEQAKNFGSLIVPKLHDPAETLRVVEARDFSSDMLLNEVQARVVAVLRMVEALSPKYHVVVTNPPYAGARGLNGYLKNWLSKAYASGKADLFSAFIERATRLTVRLGLNALVTMETWMFLSSFVELRTKLLSNSALRTMTHMPYLGKGGTSMGISFGTTAYVASIGATSSVPAEYVCVRYYETDDYGVPLEFPVANERRASVAATQFLSIPGSPIAYWISNKALNAFISGVGLREVSATRKGMVTANNDIFVRAWQEVSTHFTNVDSKGRHDAETSGLKWFPYIMGGEFRKWYGNRENVVNWLSDGHEIRTKYHPTEDRVWATNFNLEFIFRSNVNWNSITSAKLSFRLSPGGELFASTGLACFSEKNDETVLAFLNSSVASYFLSFIAPTMSANPGDIGRLPFIEPSDPRLLPAVAECKKLSTGDWDAYETSWDFTKLPLLSCDHRAKTLAATYTTLRAHWQSMTSEMQRLEEENNRIFIDAYGLQDELAPEMPLEEITLTCNPAYRYRGKYTPEELEGKLRADTMREFLSYAVGCMFGRYSLDSPGLVLANQGDGIADYHAKVPAPSFEPDKDNVIPVLDGDWFADDITERFRKFLRVTFDEDHFQENLRFIEDALGKGLRKYFTKDFHADHVKRYKKRPIYWMFSSPKGSFNALIYMHRYRGDTVSIMLNDYLREYITKLEGHRAEQQKITDNPGLKQGDRTRAQKEVDRVAKVILELRDWERDVILPLAQQKIEIDLDDGVKANYPLFGTALKKIAGLN